MSGFGQLMSDIARAKMLRYDHQQDNALSDPKGNADERIPAPPT
jgi:hypothetical protein